MYSYDTEHSALYKSSQKSTDYIIFLNISQWFRRIEYSVKQVGDDTEMYGLVRSWAHVYNCYAYSFL